MMGNTVPFLGTIFTEPQHGNYAERNKACDLVRASKFGEALATLRRGGWDDSSEREFVSLLHFVTSKGQFERRALKWDTTPGNWKVVEWTEPITSAEWHGPN